MKRLAAVFSAGMRQLSRNRLITIPIVLSALYPLLISFFLSKMQEGSSAGASSADAAVGVIFMTFPMAATMATGFIMILGSSLLSEEISAGRAGYWIAQPVSRFEFFAGMSLASLSICCLVTVVLFWGTSTAILAFLPFTPSGALYAFACPLLWTAVNLALVVIVSLFLPRIASVIISLAVAGMANFLGGVGQISEAIPQATVAAVLKIASMVSFFIFPADPLLRLTMAGLRPENSAVDEMMTMVGVGAPPPPWQIAYALVWAVAVFWLAAERFRRIDLA